MESRSWLTVRSVSTCRSAVACCTWELSRMAPAMRATALLITTPKRIADSSAQARPLSFSLSLSK